MPRQPKFNAREYALSQLRARILPSDPVEWSKEKTGVQFWSGQRKIARSVQENQLTAVKSGHGVGKSITCSQLAAWWVDTHPSDDTMVISTAPSSRQVGAIMWEEIRKIHRKAGLAGEVQRSNRWLINNTEVGFGRKPQDYDKHAFQGLHRDNLLVIIDEACGVDEWLWIAALSLITGENNRIIAIGNPDDPTSYFAKVCRPSSGWNVIQISVFDSPNFTGEEVTEEARRKLTQQSWVDFMAKEVGIGTATWISKVLGEFPDVDEMSTIPLGWIHRAQERWQEWEDAGQPTNGRYLLGVDVARYGGDKTVFAHRRGNVITSVDVFPGGDTEITADRVLEQTGATAVVDTNGVGAGVYDKIRSHGMPALPFNSGNRTSLRDSSGQIEFYNLRAAATWRLREALNPGKNPTLCLPPDDLLAADLCAPHWSTDRVGGKLVVETKKDVKKRLGRSPDRGDAVILANWLDGSQEYGIGESSFHWVDKSASDEDDDDVYGAVSWETAPDEPSLEINLTPVGRQDTSLEGFFR
jgi:AAA domain